jgi:hypothetical protein
MREGIYRVHFATPLGEGSGVVTLIGGRIRGGDAALYYNGTYQAENGKLLAHVATARHTTMPGVESVFGTDSVNITLNGDAKETSASVVGTAKEAPGITFRAQLEWLAD